VTAQAVPQRSIISRLRANARGSVSSVQNCSLTTAERHCDDGHWNAPLKRFPTALFDANGCVSFATEPLWQRSPLAAPFTAILQ